LSNRLIAVNNKEGIPNAESSDTGWDLGKRISRQPQPSKIFKKSGLNPGLPGHKWRLYHSMSTANADQDRNAGIRAGQRTSRKKILDIFYLG
jgi:hypothetical protein